MKEQQHSTNGQGLARRYSFDSTVSIFRSMQAASALPPPAELRDAAITDPELLATREAPANVLQLLAEPLHVSSGGGFDEEPEHILNSLTCAHVAKSSIDPVLSETVSKPDVPATDQQPQPVASPTAEPRDDEASSRASPAIAANHEQIFSYKDPAGVMQVMDPVVAAANRRAV